MGNSTNAIKAEGNTHSPFVLMNSNIHLVKSSSLQNVGPLPISQPRIPGDDNSLQGLNLSFVKVTAPTKSQRHVFDKLKHERAAPELKTGTPTTNNLLTKTGKINQLQIVFNARHIQDGANQQFLQPSVPNLESSAFSTSLVLAQAIIASQSIIRCQLLIGDSTNAVKAPGKTHLPFVLIH